MSSVCRVLKFRPVLAPPKGQVRLLNIFENFVSYAYANAPFQLEPTTTATFKSFQRDKENHFLKYFFNFLQKFETSFFNLIIFRRFVYFFKFPKLFSSENRRKKDRHKFTSTFSTNDGRRRLIAYNWTKAKICKNLNKSLFLTLEFLWKNNLFWLRRPSNLTRKMVSSKRQPQNTLQVRQLSNSFSSLLILWCSKPLANEQGFLIQTQYSHCC